MTPYADKISAVPAQVVGVRMSHDDAVEAFPAVVLAEEESLVRAVSEQQDALLRGHMVEQAPHFAGGAFVTYHLCFRSHIKGREHGGGSVLGMNHQHILSLLSFFRRRRQGCRLESQPFPLPGQFVIFFPVQAE